MPTSLHGIRTAYYGKRNYRRDGSYITTEFVIFVGIPIVPLKSLRVRYGGAKGIIFPIVHSEESYTVLATARPDIKQVLSIYGFVAFMACWVSAVIWAYGRMEGKLDQTVAGVLWYSVCALPGLLPMLLRRAAKRRIKCQLCN
jgi:hypothetical protein